MALLSLTANPINGLAESAWRREVVTNPGAALASWLEAHEGERPEVDGPNRGPWLDDILHGRSVLRRLGRAKEIRGDAYCASINLSWLHANGCWLPPAHRRGGHWFWSNRAVVNLRKAFERANCFAGKLVPPRRGWFCFWLNRAGSDAGGGGHLDVVTGYDAATMRVGLIGANLSDSFKARTVTLGDDGIAGWGAIPAGGRQ